MKKFNHKYNFVKKATDQEENPEKNMIMEKIELTDEESNLEENNYVYEDAVIKSIETAKSKTTVIELGTVIDGDITIEGDIIINGQINGNVTSKSSIILAGKIIGDVSCESAQLDEGLIIGDLSIINKVFMGANMTVKGNLIAKEASIEGKVLGKCSLLNGLLHLHHTGAIIGDVETSRLIIDDVAIIQGLIKVDREVLFDSI